ncbi:MCR_0457 family protein [Acinetobacter rudis]|uniref:DUF7944 domain-containing protein n=1 Tax=Acinetobacter rudis TaxID=632955 RepID=A0AAW8J389_9GAMM|nr:hypothetical protein [Acinetobacter rudis]MDQ8934456.1 hypothetical protein [Acinetobacter rudis]MDQ8951849.1 hypothetical protein [Acinetobacter rudis]MDQ9016644.1 hypothetical protein [Acinetobacter rudis]
MPIFTSTTRISKILLAFILSSAGLFSTNSFAANESAEHTQENIEVTQQNVTPEELAAIYVLSEICPSLLKKQSGFEQGYNNLLKDYLPQEKKPADYLSNLSQQSHFKAVLKQAREDAKSAGDQANIEICQDVVNYQPYK